MLGPDDIFKVKFYKKKKLGERIPRASSWSARADHGPVDCR